MSNRLNIAAEVLADGTCDTMTYLCWDPPPPDATVWFNLLFQSINPMT